ncbi:hypothetical protein [Clostridium vincentii]|uniref:GRAM domain-containing protein n=1 Tax=Clostridium vincentii TaxID=52704 RepID=A0A2T0BFH7_9CLOT|nr:hypothetical protein [Clostridium vincentii]PRR82666.1 hypothetical protein CLVI_16330 [Clostridium vincentii]
MQTNTISDIIEFAKNESIILQKVSKYWNQQNKLDRPDGVLIVTNYRLIFITKLESTFTKTGLLVFPLNLIENLEAKRVMLISPAICFKVQGTVYMFTLFSKAKEVVYEIEKYKATV